MLTLPAAYQNGFNADRPLVRLVAIDLGAGPTLYMPTYAGVAWTFPEQNTQVETRYLAAEIDGQRVSAIGEIETSADIASGGGLASIGTVRLTFLNHEAFDEFLANYDVEGRPVRIFEGYVPAGGSPAINVANDMIRVFTGRVEDRSYDAASLELECVDRMSESFAILPKKIITEEEFPAVPEENVGKGIPIVYYPDAEWKPGYKTDLPPSVILVNKSTPHFVFAGHDVRFTEDLSANPMRMIARRDDGIVGWSQFNLDPGGVIHGTTPYSSIRVNPNSAWVLKVDLDAKPSLKGEQSNYDIENIVDRSSGTYFDLTTARLFGRFDGTPQFDERMGVFSGANPFRIYVAAQILSASGQYKLGIYRTADASFFFGSLTSATGIVRQRVDNFIPSEWFDWQVMKDFEWGIDSVSGTTRVAELWVEFIGMKAMQIEVRPRTSRRTAGGT